jgi:hypothetical protein
VLDHRSAHWREEIADDLLRLDYTDRLAGAKARADSRQLDVRHVRQLLGGLPRDSQSDPITIGSPPPEPCGEVKVRIP